MSIEIKLPTDKTNIDVSNLGELIWWSNHLGICPERIISIIDVVGTSTKAIIDYKRQKGK